MGSIYKHVFSPKRIRGVDFKNRIEMAPDLSHLFSSAGAVAMELMK